MPAKAFIFYDNSNIFVSGREIAGYMEGVDAPGPFRIHLESLIALAAGGRDIGGAWAAGSDAQGSSAPVWEALQDQGVHVEVFERGALSGGEQAVDQSLQVHMLRMGYQNPQVAVLLSGDGAGHQNGHGFLNDLKLMKRNGWGIELIAWERTCNRAMREWVELNGVFIPLEKHYNQVTFLERRRIVTPLDLSNRPAAKPSIPEYQRAFLAGKKEASERIQELEATIEQLRSKSLKAERYKARMQKRSP